LKQELKIVRPNSSITSRDFALWEKISWYMLGVVANSMKQIDQYV